MKSPKELPMIIDIILKKCNLLIQKKTDIINAKYNEVLDSLKQKNLETAKFKMGSLLKLEKNIEAMIILNPILERIQKNSASMIDKKECPISLRPPLETVLYASARLQLEDMKQLKEMIVQMYGADYVTKAINNEDKKVNQDLIYKLNEANITESIVKERLSAAIKELKAKINNSSQKEGKDIFGGTVVSTNILNPKSSEDIPLGLITRLNIDDNDPLGGETSKTIDLSNNNIINKGENQINALGGNTYETMHLSIPNKDNKSLPFEESLDKLFVPTIGPYTSGRTLDLDISINLAKKKKILTLLIIKIKIKLKTHLILILLN